MTLLAVGAYAEVAARLPGPAPLRVRSPDEIARALANAAPPINPASLVVLAPAVTPANLGTAVANLDGTITFTPNNLVGTATVRYTVNSAAVPGASNIGVLTVNVTPPVGGVLFVGAAVAKLPMEQVVKALMPFFGALLLVLVAVTYIPALSLWLPGLLLAK